MTTQIKLTESLNPTSSGTKLGKKWRARVIEADRWGSSAYYPREVLERDGTRVFHEGLAMYANHPTESEEWDRPERSIHDMVGKLTSDAVMEADGLYADVEFYDSFLQEINEKHQDVGLSVRATGLTEDAEMDGRFGPVLLGLLAADSVDVVTKAGAGGKLTSILESDRSPAGTPIQKETKSMTDVTKEDLDALGASITAAFASTIETLSASFTEALRPKEVEKTAEELAEEAALAEAEGKPAEKQEVISTVDDAAILVAVAEAALPAGVLPTVRAAVVAGTSLEDAVKAQTDLREAFIASAGETGIVTRINESDKASGLARAVKVLG